jgi:ParB family transcriptional regulator, chromosome partitioning protein
VRALEEIISVGSGDTDDGSTRRPRTKKPVAPGLVELSNRLSDRFETRVKVDLGKSKGRITVEFASLDDLQRIVDIMDPHNEVAVDR